MSPEYSKSSSVSTVSHLSRARLRLLLYSYGVTPVSLVAVFLIVSLPQSPMSLEPIGSKIGGVLFWFVFSTLSFLIFLDRTRLRLVLSPEGISSVGLGYCICTPWENVAGLAVRKAATEMRGRQRQIVGLVLRFPAPIITLHFWAQRFLGWLDASPTFLPMDFQHFLPPISPLSKR